MRASLCILTAAAALTAASTVHAAEFTCPATVETDATPAGHPQSFKFRHLSFYDGDPAEMADLAPDEGPDPNKLEQRWELFRTLGRPIVMVCRYHGTDATVRKDVPLAIKECRLEGLMDEHGQVIGSPTLTCK